ncbi:aldo/keto reductase [Xanthocytophaga agilis]|uniref:Aldo/keto reductase n=1 Tax=Xanthocytophaga agilis TaxID=3048010 RepID=A0AAE3RCS1_9BACT|nr:aldo/keto reductase [Xanthocytophaga agilis]MDJ1505268.1 aldo/keto reductase [Xanthocytophaga agilis]
MHETLDYGINFLNTRDFYGAGHNELLVGKAVKGRRDQAFISVKFEAIFHNGQPLGMDLRPIAIKNFINYSLTRLGIQTIDLYQPSRMDGNVPVEDIIGQFLQPISTNSYAKSMKKDWQNKLSNWHKLKLKSKT